MQDRLVIETISTNPHYRMFHCTKSLTEDYVSIHLFNEERVERERDNLSTAGFNALKMLLHVDGIEDVSVCRYELRITKGKAFNWVSIDNAVESIFKGLSKGVLSIGTEHTKIRESSGNWDDMEF